MFDHCKNGLVQDWTSYAFGLIFLTRYEPYRETPLETPTIKSRTQYRGSARQEVNNDYIVFYAGECTEGSTHLL